MSEARERLLRRGPPKPRPGVFKKRKRDCPPKRPTTGLPLPTAATTMQQRLPSSLPSNPSNDTEPTPATTTGATASTSSSSTRPARDTEISANSPSTTTTSSHSSGGYPPLSGTASVSATDPATSPAMMENTRDIPGRGGLPVVAAVIIALVLLSLVGALFFVFGRRRRAQQTRRSTAAMRQLYLGSASGVSTSVISAPMPMQPGVGYSLYETDTTQPSRSYGATSDGDRLHVRPMNIPSTNSSRSRWSP